MDASAMSGYIFLAAAVFLSSSALVLKTTTDEVEVGRTTNVSLECVDNYPLPGISEVIMVRILKKDLSGWTITADLRVDGTKVSAKRNDVLAEGKISKRYLRLTWPVATNDIVGMYRCDAISLTAQAGVSWQKSMPTSISRKKGVTLQSQVVEENKEENKEEDLQRQRPKKQTNMEDVTETAADNKTDCVQQAEEVLQNVTAKVEALEASFESKWKSQLQVLSHTVEQKTRQCPDQPLSQIRQILEHMAIIMGHDKKEFLQQKEDILENVTATADLSIRELLQQKDDIRASISATFEKERKTFLQQKEDILESATATQREFQQQKDDMLESIKETFEQEKTTFLQQKEDILESVTAKVQALEASFDSKLNAMKIQLRPESCADVQSSKHRPVVTLINGMTVVCDTKTDSGGWIVIQRRVSADVDFYRGWADYKNGFGDLAGNFWFGLEKIHQLTNTKQYELRIDFAFNGKDNFAIYNNFLLYGESKNYKLQISGFSGNVANDMAIHNGQAFSTKDRDNDSSSSVCANYNHGAWWYNSCHYVNLNGKWGIAGSMGMNWKSVTGWTKSVTSCEMKIRPFAS
ncbi:angiopoietin-2 [Aplysia californica]|uniref:Angiopoietin-2 n=1 Tax=Aplysia californica TaxID=6500 RepID=A0ABM0K0H5_APLCA|nr:angiopoietin-2 [Aplysia californica]